MAVVQARMGSSRLPGKMLMDLDGHPLVDHVLFRLSQLHCEKGLLDAIVVATSAQPENDTLAEYVASRWPAVHVVRGSENDVLSRFVQAVEATGADLVVRITGDCPVINEAGIRQMLMVSDEESADVVNYRPGFEYVDKGVEVVAGQALQKLIRDKALTPHDREHVTSALYRAPDIYRVVYADSLPQLRRGDIRLTIDTPQDIAFFRELAARCFDGLINTPLNDVLAILDNHPDLKDINADAGRKSTQHEPARIGFRCDGGATLGMGHVVGCLRLARLLADELGWGAEFLCRANPSVRQLIQREGFAVEQLPEGLSVDAESSRLLEKASESDWSAVVINFNKTNLEHYQTQFERIRSSGLPLAFMDNPLPPGCYQSDLLINALPHPDYPGYDPNRHPNCLDGLEYFLPAKTEGDDSRKDRAEFWPVERVLIAMGGGNVAGLTERVLEGLARAGFNGVVDVVVGAAHSTPPLQLQEALAQLGLEGVVSVNVNDLPERMRRANLGFSGLGLTTYEMASAGLPTLIVANSSFNAKVADSYCARYGVARLIGAWPDVDADLIAAEFLSYTDQAKSTQQIAMGVDKQIGARSKDIIQAFQSLVTTKGKTE